MTESAYSINERATEHCAQMTLSNLVSGWYPTPDAHIIPQDRVFSVIGRCFLAVLIPHSTATRSRHKSGEIERLSVDPGPDKATIGEEETSTRRLMSPIREEP